MASELLPDLRTVTVTAVVLLILVGLITIGAGIHNWAPSGTTSNAADIALGHRPQPPPPPRGPVV